MKIETKQIDERALQYSSQADSFIITNNEQYEAAGAFLCALKNLQKEIDATFKEPIAQAFKLHKNLVAKSKEHSEPITKAEIVIKKKIALWIEECERQRRIEQTRLDIISKVQGEDANQITVAPKIDAKVAGISSRKVFKWKLNNIQHVNRKFMCVDNKKINALVKALGTSAEQVVGGITIYSDSVISARS